MSLHVHVYPPSLSIPVIASEAKQSSLAAAKKLDCFVASLLAMTARREASVHHFA
jgi:hypothetical protein